MTPRQRGWLLPPLAVALALGILLGRAASVWYFSAGGLALALCAVLLSRGRVRFCALLALAFCLGGLRGFFAFHPALPPEGDYLISGVVTAEVETRGNRQVRTALSHVTLDGQPVSGGAYWSFYAEEPPADLQPGKRISFYGRLYHPSGAENPDGYDFREELLRRGIRVGVYGREELTVSDPDFFSLPGWAASLRHRLSLALLASPLGEEAGGYAAAMLLGNRSLVPGEDRTAFSRLGIAHLLSVSGFHVGVLAAFLALLFRMLRLPQGLRLGLYALALGFYVLLCGSAQPVLRASLLLLLSRRGRMLARPRSLLHLLCAAFAGMLLLSPAQLTGLSFLLSFSAVLGLALVSPFLDRALRLFLRDDPGSFPDPRSPAGLLRDLRSRLVRGLRGSLSAGLGAQLGILLPQLGAFQELPLLSLLLNIPMLFLSGALIGLFWLSLITLPLPALSAPFCVLARELTSLILSLVRSLGRLPGIVLWTAAPNAVSFLGWTALVLGLCVLFRFRKRTRLLLSGAGLLVLCLSLLPLPHETAEYYQFSVGDADAALLWDHGEAVVLDTGYEDGVLSDFLHRRRLTPSAVILTHLHSDHAAGLASLREDGIPVSVICLPDGAEAAEVHPDMLALLEEFRAAGTQIRTLAAGDVLPLPSGEIRVLWPEKGKTRPGGEANESSLTLLIRLRGTSFLHTGDLDGRYEMYAAVPADLLKAAHHGSVHSSSEAFLRSVNPQAVLLSCGDESRFRQFRGRLSADTALYATAIHGMLTVRFREGSFSVEGFLPGPETGVSPVP